MCQPCNTARAYPAHRMHCPSCIFCGARLIQNLGRLPIAVSDITRRRPETLALWLDYGHDEKEIRGLAKGPAPLAEQTMKAKK